MAISTHSNLTQHLFFKRFTSPQKTRKNLNKSIEKKKQRGINMSTRFALLYSRITNRHKATRLVFQITRERYSVKFC